MLNQFNVSLWGDEAFSAILSMKSIPEIIKIISRDTSPPLYNLTEHLWFGIFGTSEVAIRALSFLYFLLAVLFVYKIGKFLWGRRTGAFAAALTFFNPFFFTYAFEGRMYSILAFTVAASMYFFITRRWIYYALATAAALYSHHFAVFAILVQGIWFLKEYFFGKKKIALMIFKSFVLIGILYLPWTPALYNQTKMVGGGFWLGTPNLTDLRNLIYKYLAEGIAHPLSQIGLYLAFAVLALRNWSKDIEKSLFALGWFLIPIGAAWFISQKFSSIFFDRYLLYVIPAAMLILASNLRKISVPFLVGIIACFLVIDFFYFTHPTKRPFGQLATYVKQVQRGDDYLINWNSAAHHLWESKYYQIPAPIYLNEGETLPYYVGTALMEEGDIVYKLPAKLYRLGVVTSGPVEEVSLPGYTKLEEKVFGPLNFIWYQKAK
jgi:mannosyltransferase